MKDAAVFDPTVIDDLRELGGGDDAFLADLFVTYLDQAEETLGKLREALAFEDRDTFSRAAHALAGASLNMGASSVAGICRGIEATLSFQAARPNAAQLNAIEFEVNRAASEITNGRVH
jgi:HPt (histidine-containing phosphotransfer) domain-containing protein